MSFIITLGPRNKYQELLDGTSGILCKLSTSSDCAFASPQGDLASLVPAIITSLWTVDCRYYQRLTGPSKGSDTHNNGDLNLLLCDGFVQNRFIDAEYRPVRIDNALLVQRIADCDVQPHPAKRHADILEGSCGRLRRKPRIIGREDPQAIREDIQDRLEINGLTSNSRSLRRVYYIIEEDVPEAGGQALCPLGQHFESQIGSHSPVR